MFRTRFRSITLLSFLVLIASLAGTARAEPPPLEVGQPFPDLVLPALDDGRPRSIRDFRGERVVLHVFASW